MESIPALYKGSPVHSLQLHVNIVHFMRLMGSARKKWWAQNCRLGMGK